MRITKSFVDKVAPPPAKPDGRPSQQFYRDSALPGFGLRVTSGGTKSFIVEMRVQGKVKRKTLGKYGKLTVEQARKLAMQFTGNVAAGRNPINEAKNEQVKTLTLREAFEDYLKTRKDLKATTLLDYRRNMDSALKGWQDKRLSAITKDMVELRHREIGKRSPARANNAMRMLRAIFNHAMGKYEDTDGNPIILVNPVSRLSQNRAWYTIKARETLVKPHQLKPWFEATLQLNNETTRDYLHFVLFNGLRRSEASTLQWDTVDFKGQAFTIPETKNHRPHTLPFSDFTRELLERRFETRTSPYVFPSETERGYLIEPRTAVERVSELSGVSFTLHDLRRTFTTLAESLDIPSYALKRLINHKDPNDVTGGYIISDVERLRRPMQQICDYMLQLINAPDETDEAAIT